MKPRLHAQLHSTDQQSTTASHNGVAVASQRRFRIIGETGEEYEPVSVSRSNSAPTSLLMAQRPTASVSTAPPHTSLVGEGTFGTVYCGRSTTTGRIVALKRIAIGNPGEGIPPLLLREISLLKKLESMRVNDVAEGSQPAECLSLECQPANYSSLLMNSDQLYDYSSLPSLDTAPSLAWCREIRQQQVAQRHPNIVQLCDIALVNHSIFNVLKDVYLVFEYLDCDLHKLIHEHKQRRIDDVDCRNIMHQALRGVAFLHENMIMHRDLKPANILISSDTLHVKIADFGLSRALNFNQPLTETVVTIWYRPPEVLLHTSYIYAVDIWSLGCILFELIERRVLFKARTEVEQLRMITDMMGMPDRDRWPEQCSILWDHVAPSENAGGNKANKKPPFCSLLSSWRRDAAELLRSMLRFFPADRLTAEEVLKSAYFCRTRPNVRVVTSPQARFDVPLKLAENADRKLSKRLANEGGMPVKRFRSADNEAPNVVASVEQYALQRNDTINCAPATGSKTATTIARDEVAAKQFSAESERRKLNDFRTKINRMRRQLSDA